MCSVSSNGSGPVPNTKNYIVVTGGTLRLNTWTDHWTGFLGSTILPVPKASLFLLVDVLDSWVITVGIVGQCFVGLDKGKCVLWMNAGNLKPENSLLCKNNTRSSLKRKIARGKGPGYRRRHFHPKANTVKKQLRVWRNGFVLRRTGQPIFLKL